MADKVVEKIEDVVDSSGDEAEEATQSAVDEIVDSADKVETDITPIMSSPSRQVQTAFTPQNQYC